MNADFIAFLCAIVSFGVIHYGSRAWDRRRRPVRRGTPFPVRPRVGIDSADLATVQRRVPR